jgi:hypothetical protein
MSAKANIYQDISRALFVEPFFPGKIPFWPREISDDTLHGFTPLLYLFKEGLLIT